MKRSVNQLTRMIRLLSFFKVPLLALCWPKVVELTASTATIRIRRWWLTSNHVGSMYFGALAMGAELSVATQLLMRMGSEKLPVSFIFKDAQFQFLSRAEAHVCFRTDEVAQVDELIAETLRLKTRCDKTINGYAYTVNEPTKKILEFQITLSLKPTKKGML